MKITQFKLNILGFAFLKPLKGVVGEADNVNSVSASACHIDGPKGVSPGQKALLHGTLLT